MRHEEICNAAVECEEAAAVSCAVDHLQNAMDDIVVTHMQVVKNVSDDKLPKSTIPSTNPIKKCR
jgi:hypothetical protein